MPFDWVLAPTTQHGVLALGWVSCLGFCISATIRGRAERRRMSKAQASLDQKLNALSAAIDQMRRGASEPRERSPRSLEALNLTKRARTLRMYRRGDSLTTIAAALKSPLNEIELLLKVRGYLDSP